MDAGKESSAKSANISSKESLIGIANIFTGRFLRQFSDSEQRSSKYIERIVEVVARVQSKTISNDQELI